MYKAKWAGDEQWTDWTGELYNGQPEFVLYDGQEYTFEQFCPIIVARSQEILNNLGRLHYDRLMENKYLKAKLDSLLKVKKKIQDFAEFIEKEDKQSNFLERKEKRSK